MAKPQALLQLTSLRFFAALMVLSSHLWFLADRDNLLRPIATHLFYEGYSGVSFFFMLSGFILSHSYHEALVSRAVSVKRYMLLRLARIYPLHLLTALPFAVYMIATQGVRVLPVIAANLALLQSWIPNDGYYFSLNDPSWSLSDELFFYTLFPLLTRLSVRKLAALALGLLLSIVIVQGYFLLRGEIEFKRGDVWLITHWVTYINPLTRLLDFVIGIMLYHGVTHGWLRRLVAPHEPLAVMAFLGSLLCANLLGAPQILRAQLLYLPAIAYLIYSFAFGEGVLSKWLCHRWLVLLGEASFALYMIHLVVINLGLTAYENAEQPFSILLFALGMTFIAVLLSLIVFKYIERPIHHALRAYIQKMT